MPLIADRFELGEFIAQGGMGAVYRGLDRQTGQAVAIKSIRPELVDAALIARFQQEGETLRTLNHPNIVKLVATVRDGDQQYLVMEYVGSGSLADLLTKQSRLGAEQTVTIALELADALARAHHLKVIHRDLKPANVLLAEDGTPRLTDFGVARTAQGSLTGTGVIVGTLSYLAPEILNGEPADAGADIWAFGVTLFELLTGRLPFRADSPAALITSILTQPTPDLEALRPELPVALVDLVYRMLDKDARQRIGSMRQIAAELEALYKNGPDIGRLLRYSVTIDSDESSLLSLPTPTVVRDNLPVQTTPFVGREAELTELAKMIADSGTRLITILGPGGMGKTRLALEAASVQLRAFADGVYFVSLAPISDPEAIVAMIADAIKFQFYAGSEPKQELLDYLREKAMFLVLDNFEHLLDGSPLITEILNSAKGVKVLATSRERLNLQGEVLFRIEGMDFPDWETPEDAAEYSAVKLFLQSARRVEQSFGLTADNVKYLARICRLVQGMPLGILLAAAWIDQLPVEEIATEIGRSADFLETEQRDAPIRQRSIRAVFESSWTRLTVAEQEVFKQLSVFRGGFTREAAQAVTGASLKTLAALVNKSLLRRDPTGRYDIHELLRQYAQSKLDEVPGALAAAYERHWTYFAQLVGSQTERLKGPHELAAVLMLNTDFDNIRIAWERAFEAGNGETMNIGVEGLSLFLFEQGRYLEARDFMHAIIEKVGKPTTRQAEITIGQYWAFYGLMFNYVENVGDESLVESKQILETVERLLAHDDSRLEWAMAMLWYSEIFTFTLRHQLDATEQIMIERLNQTLVIFEQANNNWGAGMILWVTGESDQDVARCRALLQETGPFWQCFPLFMASNHAWSKNDWLSAKAFREQIVDIIQHDLAFQNHHWLAFAIYPALTHLSIRLGEFKDAVRYAEMAVASAKLEGKAKEIEIVLPYKAWIAFAKKNFAEAEVIMRECIAKGSALNESVHLIFRKYEFMVITSLQGHFSEGFGYCREILATSHEVNLNDRHNFILGSILCASYLFCQLDRLIKSAELLACVMTDEILSTNAEYFFAGSVVNIDITNLMAELKAKLPPEEFAAAWERGKALDLDTVVAQILAEPPLFALDISDKH